MKKTLIYALSAVSILSLGSITSAFAGGMESGGGNAVICRGADRKIVSAEMLDVYEGRIRFEYFINEMSADPGQQLQWAASKLGLLPGGLVNEFIVAAVTEVAVGIIKGIKFLPPGVILHPAQDLGNEWGVVLPDGCELSAAGYYDHDGILRVSRPVYEKLTPTNRAAFILHEAIYKLARDTSRVKDSALSRKLTALLLSTNGAAEQVRTLADQLFYRKLSAGIPYTNTRAVIEKISEGFFHLRVSPSIPVEFFYEVSCQDLAGKIVGSSFSGISLGGGEAVIEIPDAPCARISLSVNMGAGLKLIPFDYRLYSGTHELVRGSNSGWSTNDLRSLMIVNLAHFSELQELPRAPESCADYSTP